MKCKRCGSILVKGQIICSVCDMDNSDQVSIFNTYPQYNDVQNNYQEEITDTSSYEEYSYEQDKSVEKKTRVIKNKSGATDFLIIIVMVIILVTSLYLLNKNGKINLGKRNNKTTTRTTTVLTTSKITTTSTTTITSDVINSNNENINVFKKLQNNVLNNINKKAVVDCDDDCSYVYSYDTSKYELNVSDNNTYYQIDLKVLSGDNSLKSSCLKENDLTCSEDKISKKIYK